MASMKRWNSASVISKSTDSALKACLPSIGDDETTTLIRMLHESPLALATASILSKVEYDTFRDSYWSS